MSPFVLGLLIGVFAGTPIGFAVAALCITASRDDVDVIDLRRVEQPSSQEGN